MTTERQSKVQSIKDNPGTLLISPYTYRRWTLLNNPAPLEDVTDRMQEESETDDGDKKDVIGREKSVEK